MTNTPFVIERICNASPEKVWHAITDKDQMSQWYFQVSAFRPETGFTFYFEGGKDDKVYRHICTIREVIPQKKLTYSWQYEGYEGKSFVTFELFPKGATTRLKLTHEGLETFPANNPDLAKENFAGGWTYIIGTSLLHFIDTNREEQNGIEPLS